MPAPNAAEAGVLLPEAARVADDDLGEQRRPDRLVDVGVGDPVAVRALEAAAERGAGRRIPAGRSGAPQPAATRRARSHRARRRVQRSGLRGHGHRSDDSVADKQLLGVLARIAGRPYRAYCTHQLNTPVPAAAVAEQAAPVVSRRAENACVAFHHVVGDLRPARRCQGPFAVEAAGLEPREDDVDRRPEAPGAACARSRQDVLAHRTAVGPVTSSAPSVACTEVSSSSPQRLST